MKKDKPILGLLTIECYIFIAACIIMALTLAVVL